MKTSCIRRIFNMFYYLNIKVIFPVVKFFVSFDTRVSTFCVKNILFA